MKPLTSPAKAIINNIANAYDSTILFFLKNLFKSSDETANADNNIDTEYIINL